MNKQNNKSGQKGQALLEKVKAWLRASKLDVSRASIHAALLYLMAEHARAAMVERRAPEVSEKSSALDPASKEKLESGDTQVVSSAEELSELDEAASDEAASSANAKGDSRSDLSVDKELQDLSVAGLDERLVASASGGLSPESSSLGQSAQATSASEFSLGSQGSLSSVGWATLGLVGLGLAVGGGGSKTSAESTTYGDGVVADGYISGATVKLYSMVNGVETVIATTTTNQLGQYQFDQALLNSATKIVASGGLDTSTGLNFSFELSAPAGSTVINPLSTLVQAFKDSNPGMSIQQASDAVVAKLGLPAGFNPLTSDPIAMAASGQAGGLQAQLLAGRVADLLVSGAQALVAQGVVGIDAFNGLLGNLVDVLAGQTTSIDLTDAANLKSVLTGGTVQTLVTAAGGNFTAFDADMSQRSEVLASFNSITATSLEDLYSLQKLAQGGGTTSAIADALAALSNTPVNDAPVLYASASPTLATIYKDIPNSDNSGTPVSAMVVNGSVIDPDGSPVESIYVTSVGTGGTWEYKVDGENWVPFNFSENQGKGLLLQHNDSVRFLPDALFSGTSSITFGAWDETSGSAGDYVTVSAKGGSSAFSLATDDASITVLDDITLTERQAALLLKQGVTYPEAAGKVVLRVDAEGSTLQAKLANILINQAGGSLGPVTVAQVAALGVDVLDVIGDGVIRLTEQNALDLVEAGIRFADSNDQVTLELDAEGVYLNTRMANVGVVPGALNAAVDPDEATEIVGDLGRGFAGSTYGGLGVDVFDVVDNGVIRLTEQNALDLVEAGIRFADSNDQVTLELDAEGLSADLTSEVISQLGQGVAGSVYGLGVDVLDVIDSSLVRLSEQQVLDMFEAGIRFADNDDKVTLELDAEGSYLNARLGNAGVGQANDAVSAEEATEIIAGLGQGIEGSVYGLGVDVLDVVDNGVIRLTEQNALDLVEAGIRFADSNDQVTLELDAEGSYLNTRLANVGVMPGALNAAVDPDEATEIVGDLGRGFAGSTYVGLGVDVLDVVDNGVIRLTEQNALDLVEAGIRFSDSDEQVTLELNLDAVEGTYLSGKLSAAGAVMSDPELSLGNFGKSGLGVDVLDLQGSGEVMISDTDARALVDAGMRFAANDSITLDLTYLEDEGADAAATYLGNLRTSAEGLTLSELGVDSVIVFKESVSNEFVEDSMDLWDAPSESADAPAVRVALGETGQPVQLATEIAFVVNELRHGGVEFNDESSLNNLLDALNGSIVSDTNFDSDLFEHLRTVTGKQAVGFKALEEASVVMSDELAVALAAAGMFEALPDANIEIDAGANAILAAPLSLLAEFGVDFINTNADSLQINLGDISGLQEMASTLLELLNKSQEKPLFAEDVEATLLVDDETANLFDGNVGAVLQAGLIELGFSNFRINDGEASEVKLIGASSDLLSDLQKYSGAA